MDARLLILCSALLTFSACDVIEGPYGETYTPPEDSSSVQTQHVLLEDFTGHTCGTCPPAAKKAEELKGIYGDRLIVVTTHLGDFALPQNNPDSSFYYDFRTPAGNEMDAYYQIGMGVPRGMVNRIKYNDKLLLGRNDWSSAISALLTDTASISMAITKSYNESTRKLDIEVNAEYIKWGTALDKLVIYLVEDSIINWQRDYAATPEDIPDYVHRHVLRKAITPTFGEPLSSVPIAPGSTFTKTYSLTLSSEYKDRHCEIIAFIHNGNEDKNIYQAVEKAVK